MELINKIMTTPENLIAVLALVTSIVSILYTAKSLKIQREHNFKSVKPIAHIDLGDYETDIYIKITNNGIGPLIIKNVQITNGTISSENLIDILPENIRLNTLWNTFSAKIITQSIRVDNHLFLLQKKFPNDNSISPEQESLRTELREALKHIIIKIEYTDIYEVNKYITTKDLAWFGRRFNLKSPISSLT